MMTTNAPHTHFHLHHGNPDEIEDNRLTHDDLPVHPTVEAVLTTVHELLNTRKRSEATRPVVSYVTYRTLKDHMTLVENMTDEHKDILTSVGLELEIEPNEAISILPCQAPV